MSGAGDHKGRPYGFIMEFKGLGIRPVETTNSSIDGRPNVRASCAETPWTDPLGSRGAPQTARNQGAHRIPAPESCRLSGEHHDILEPSPAPPRLRADGYPVRGPVDSRPPRGSQPSAIHRQHHRSDRPPHRVPRRAPPAQFGPYSDPYTGTDCGPVDQIEWPRQPAASPDRQPNPCSRLFPSFRHLGTEPGRPLHL